MIMSKRRLKKTDSRQNRNEFQRTFFEIRIFTKTIYVNYDIEYCDVITL